MCKKSGARRTYRNPMGCVIKRMPLAEDQKTDLGLAYHLSLQAMLSGRGDEHAWSVIACTLNIAMTLAEAVDDADSCGKIQAAQEAIVRVYDRAQIVGKWAFDGAGLNAVKEALILHDKQIIASTRGKILDALGVLKSQVLKG